MSHNLFQIFSRLFHSRFGKKSPLITSQKTKHVKRPQSRRQLHLDTLEARVVPAAPLVSSVLGGTAGTAIVGTVYEDLDSSGTRTNGENGVKDWTVYLDLDQSGTLNKDAVGDWEPSAITNKDGDYVINHLKPGTYRVSDVVQPGWVATAAVSQDVTVTKDREMSADFFNFSGGEIVGVVWNDPDGDGIRATDLAGEFTEAGLAGWTVFVDLDNNRTLDPSDPSTLTDSDGNYSFTNLPPGDYQVIEVLPEGWDVSSGFDPRQDVAVVARTQAILNFANFSTTNGSIQGTIWNDLNANGIREIDPATGEFTEPGLAGWTVFLDSNGNGAADTGETATLTDASGAYAFVSLTEGDYEVTEVLPVGWDVSTTFDSRQTVAVFGGEVSVAGDFANFTVLNGSIRGTVWNDANRNGVRDATLAGAFTEPGLADWTVYLDRNNNRLADEGEPTALTDVNGDYVFADLQVGDYEVREILPTGWEVTTGYGDSVGVTVYSGSESVAPDFANFNLSTAIPGSVGGVVWNDLDGDGIRDSNAGGFTDPGQAGWTVFADLNSNGALDAGEPSAVTTADGSYLLSGILPGTVTIVEQATTGWRATAPSSGQRTFSLKNGENATGVDFGNWTLQDAAIRGVVFADTDKSGLRGAGERGLDGITVYLDLNDNGSLDAAEPQVTTTADLYFTPAIDESGAYSFTHLAAGTYTVRAILPAVLSATPAGELQHVVTLVGAESHNGIDTAAVYRPTEVHGIKFDDADGDHVRDADEHGVGGVTVFVDLDRDDSLDDDEPRAVTADDGSYSFVGLPPGAYVVREVLSIGHETTYPTTTGGILWPQGVSSPAVGDVSPTSITASLGVGESHRLTVSITLPNTGALTNLVDVFLLFDDTGSFVSNSPIVRSAFPTIITQLQASLPGIDLGFGVGRFEEYGNFAWEYGSGRPFILNQPIVAASTAGYMTAIQAALNRTTPGYGGDGPETDIEALYQLVTGLGFDGNNNGSVLDSGAAGLASTQLNPGNSGDVPSFTSFQADVANNVLPAAGTIGGGGFRAGALPVILVATDTGFAFQPKGETTVTGVSGLTLPVSALSQTSRPTTPFDSGAGLQQTITGLNALGGLVIGLGTNTEPTLDPRQGLEALSKLTGAVNRSTTTIANGTADAIAPGDPLYFQIATGFAGSVASGVVTAIQNAVTNVAVDITVQASDPRVKIVNYSGVRGGIGSGQTASFDIEFVGDGVPHRFDLQFVRSGTNVVLGSIPIVLGTPIPGDGYEFEDLSEGEICDDVDFGSRISTTTTTAPTIAVTGGTFTFDGTAHAASATATGARGATVDGTFAFSYNGSPDLPTNAGVYTVVASFTSADPTYSAATATTTLTIAAATPTIAATGGTFTFDDTAHPAAAIATGVAGATVDGSFTFTYNGESTVPEAVGVYSVLASFTSADANYTNATGTATLTIDAAALVTPTISVTGGTYTFDGAAHAATAIASGDDGASIEGAYSFRYNGSLALPVDAGVYSVVVTFTSANPNYTDATGTTTLTIEAATPTVTVVGGTFTFDGSSHAAMATTTVPGAFTFSYNGSPALPTNAGGYTVVATFTSDDPNYTDATGTTTLTIEAAVPTISVGGGTFIFDGSAHAATATASNGDGASIAGTFAYTYNGSAVLPTNAGVYEVTATFTSADANYSSSSATGGIIIKKATPVFSNLNVPTIPAGAASVTITGHLAAGAVAPVGDIVTGTLNGIVQSAIVDDKGDFTLTFATTTLTAGTYPVTITDSGRAINFNAAANAAGILVVDAVGESLNASGINVSAIAGAPLTRPVATFRNPLGAVGAYTATISWGDGATSTGVIVGSGASLTVIGSHTYADPGTAAIRVTIVDSLGKGLSAMTTSVVTVTNLGLAAGKTKEASFWQSGAGQKLIKEFNGSSSRTDLGNWLASNFPNLYGASAGGINLTGKSNAYIASMFQNLWRSVGDGAATQVLATAFNVYATTLTLGGAQGFRYGFDVSVTGFGARTFNVGSRGAAVGVANNTKRNVFQMLRGVDQQAKNGVFHAGNRSLQSMAKSLFDKLNSI